jgi:hypothetical protein
MRWKIEVCGVDGRPMSMMEGEILKGRLTKESWKY